MSDIEILKDVELSSYDPIAYEKYEQIGNANIGKKPTEKIFKYFLYTCVFGKIRKTIEVQLDIIPNSYILEKITEYQVITKLVKEYLNYELPPLPNQKTIENIIYNFDQLELYLIKEKPGTYNIQIAKITERLNFLYELISKIKYIYNSNLHAILIDGSAVNILWDGTYSVSPHGTSDIDLTLILDDISPIVIDKTRVLESESRKAPFKVDIKLQNIRTISIINYTMSQLALIFPSASNISLPIENEQCIKEANFIKAMNDYFMLTQRLEVLARFDQYNESHKNILFSYLKRYRILKNAEIPCTELEHIAAKYSKDELLQLDQKTLINFLNRYREEYQKALYSNKNNFDFGW